jgi:hypothetical protein
VDFHKDSDVATSDLSSDGPELLRFWRPIRRGEVPLPALSNADQEILRARDAYLDRFPSSRSDESDASESACNSSEECLICTGEWYSTASEQASSQSGTDCEAHASSKADVLSVPHRLQDPTFGPQVQANATGESRSRGTKRIRLQETSSPLARSQAEASNDGVHAHGSGARENRKKRFRTRPCDSVEWKSNKCTHDLLWNNKSVHLVEFGHFIKAHVAGNPDSDDVCCVEKLYDDYVRWVNDVGRSWQIPSKLFIKCARALLHEAATEQGPPVWNTPSSSKRSRSGGGGRCL